MNNINDFVSLLINNRERIVDKLLQNYSYDYLLKIFDHINNENNPQIKIEPTDKWIYRILSGSYQNSRYNKSSIDYIPSAEVVNSFILLAKYFSINYVEEIYAGLGILSALIKKTNSDLLVTSSDSFENEATCNQLSIAPIVKRTPIDFKYYQQLNEPLPKMVISSYYPPVTPKNNSNTEFLDEISFLIESNNHSVIILILPIDFVQIYDILYFILQKDQYNLYTYYGKIIDKYFFISNLMKEYYKTGTLIHVLIKREIDPGNKILDFIFEKAIVPSKYFNTTGTRSKLFKTFYDKFSQKLVKSIYKNHIFTKPMMMQDKLKQILNNLNIFNKNNILVPDYIYDIDEFILWSNCIIKKLFFVFKNRMQFYIFFTKTQCIKNSNESKNFKFPNWITSESLTYVYLYLETVCEKNNWNISRNSFTRIWNQYCFDNKKLLIKN